MHRTTGVCRSFKAPIGDNHACKLARRLRPRAYCRETRSAAMQCSKSTGGVGKYITSRFPLESDGQSNLARICLYWAENDGIGMHVRTWLSFAWLIRAWSRGVDEFGVFSRRALRGVIFKDANIAELRLFVWATVRRLYSFCRLIRSDAIMRHKIFESFYLYCTCVYIFEELVDQCDRVLYFNYGRIWRYLYYRYL